MDAVDTTAAGDTFIGYFAAQLADDPDDIIAAIESQYWHRLAVTRPGAIDSIPFGHEVESSAKRPRKDTR